MEHCIAVFQKQDIEKAYRIYVTDALKLISENTAGLVKGKAMSKRFYDIVYTDKQQNQIKSADEIIQEINHKAGLVMIE